VLFATPALAFSPNYLEIKYQVGMVWINPDSVWANAMYDKFQGERFDRNPVVALSFSLEGADKDAFSIRYEVGLNDKKPPQLRSDGKVAGLPVGPTGGLGPFQTPDVRKLKVEVISKI
jgi:hypothetical protein